MKTIFQGAEKVITESNQVIENETINGKIILCGVENVVLKNLFVSGGHSGIVLYNCTNCLIEGCSVSDIDEWAGILLILSCGNTIRKNRVKNAKVTGIYMEAGSDDNLITENIVSHCGYGIECFFSSRNIIQYNTVDNNNGLLPVCGGQGILLQSFSRENRVFLNEIKQQNKGILICSSSDGGICETNKFNDCEKNIVVDKTSYTYISRNNLSEKNDIKRMEDYLFCFFPKFWRKSRW